MFACVSHLSQHTHTATIPLHTPTHTHSTAMESLQKKLALARETTDYEALEVVQKTIEAVQKKFAEEVSGVSCVYYEML